jgi:hypothetical protein
MRADDGALPADGFIALLAEVLEEDVVEGAVFIGWGFHTVKILFKL